MRRTPTALAAVLAALTLFVAACGGDDEPESSGSAATPAATETPADAGAIAKNDANSAISLKIGSKNFTEQKVLGEIYAQGLAAAGYTTSTDLNLGDQDTALAALKGGQIDAYPEYTGTALTAFFKKDAGDLPRTPPRPTRSSRPCSSRTASRRSRRRRSPAPTRSLSPPRPPRSTA